MRLAPLLLLGTLLLPQAGSTADVGFKVIVSRDNEVGALSRRAVARMFLKRTTNWPNGSAIAPVDQSARSAVRTAFTAEVLQAEGFGKMSAVENHWQQQIFSGRGSPPPIEATDAAVIEFVVANPTAIGYVSGQADVSAVKVVTLEGQE